MWIVQIASSMKTAADPRHIKRRAAVRYLFAESFTSQKNSPEIVVKILKKKKKLDKIIETSAPSWPVGKINKIDLAILYLAIFELSLKKNPPKVIIDEAVELAKEFGAESSGPFVNGVLGTIYEKSNLSL